MEKVLAENVKRLCKEQKKQLKDLASEMGVDPARNGDRTAIVFRQGRRLYKPLIFGNMTETELAGEIILLLNKYRCNKVFIDVGYGYGTIDILKEKGLGDIVCGIPFNSKPLKRDVYSNKRTEIYGEMRDWLLQDGGVDIPDDQVLVNELLSIPDFHINSNGQFVMDPKDEIKKMLNGKSPDIADAIALTFSENVPILNENIGMEKIRIINNFR